MKRCPITYEVISEQEHYSQQGLRLLSPRLHELSPLPLSASEQRMEAIARAGKMSIQGVQTKLSAQLKINEHRFAIVDSDGHYILKTQSDHWPQLPENEAITMTLAKTLGLEVPLHGMVYAKDNSLAYFIKRFDRAGKNQKLAVEDFAQLLGLDRSTKYDSSMEKVVTVLLSFCSFPAIESVKLLKLTLFNFLIGNEDMHLKNFSLITRDNKILMSPAYDLINSTIVQSNVKEEIALPLNGRKNNLRKQDFIDYFAVERLGLNQMVISQVVNQLQQAMSGWETLLRHSFLSRDMKAKYKALLEDRRIRLGF